MTWSSPTPSEPVVVPEQQVTAGGRVPVSTAADPTARPPQPGGGRPTGRAQVAAVLAAATGAIDAAADQVRAMDRFEDAYGDEPLAARGA